MYCATESQKGIRIQGGRRRGDFQLVLFCKSLRRCLDTCTQGLGLGGRSTCGSRPATCKGFRLLTVSWVGKTEPGRYACAREELNPIPFLVLPLLVFHTPPPLPPIPIPFRPSQFDLGILGIWKFDSSCFQKPHVLLPCFISHAPSRVYPGMPRGRRYFSCLQEALGALHRFTLPRHRNPTQGPNEQGFT